MMSLPHVSTEQMTDSLLAAHLKASGSWYKPQKAVGVEGSRWGRHQQDREKKETEPFKQMELAWREYETKRERKGRENR